MVPRYTSPGAFSFMWCQIVGRAAPIFLTNSRRTSCTGLVFSSRPSRRSSAILGDPRRSSATLGDPRRPSAILCSLGDPRRPSAALCSLGSGGDPRPSRRSSAALGSLGPLSTQRVVPFLCFLSLKNNDGNEAPGLRSVILLPILARARRTQIWRPKRGRIKIRCES